MSIRSSGLVFSVVVAAALPVRAAVISEYFNYGATGGALGGNGTAVGGWSGAWSNQTGATYSTSNLTLTHPGYQNTNNAASTGSASGTNRTNGSTRAFSTGLSGAIWVSMLARYTGTSSQDAILGIEKGGLNGTDNCIGILGTEAIVRWGSGSTGQTIQTGLVKDQVYLFLAKIETDYSGTFDRITAWVNPNLSNLGTGTVKDGKDIVGTALDSVAVFNSSGNVDAIRISNDAGAFSFVTTGVVPEPAAMGLLALGSMAALARRRHGR